MSDIGKENYALKQYLENVVNEPLKIFEILTTWTEKDKIKFGTLLDELKKPFNKDKETTKSKGDKLEAVASFIINKSFFYKVISNVRTGTNEIDEVIMLSKKGRQAIESFGISRSLISIDEDVFIGECKNFNKKLNVTYVGKFYSLLVSTDTSFGIIFTQKGLSGNEQGYHDSYGLIKVLRIIEKYKNNKDLYIIDFTLEDYELLLKGKNFFEIIDAKKLAIKVAANYDNFIKENTHDNTDKIMDILKTVV